MTKLAQWVILTTAWTTLVYELLTEGDLRRYYAYGLHRDRTVRLGCWLKITSRAGGPCQPNPLVA